jgi:hypothetical protein
MWNAGKCRMPSAECGMLEIVGRRSGFVIRVCFVIRASDFVIRCKTPHFCSFAAAARPERGEGQEDRGRECHSRSSS